MRIAFRCDASVEIGSGHLMRCLTLADALKVRGTECLFLAAPSTAAWRGQIEARGHALRLLEVMPRSPDASAAPDDSSHAAWLPWGWEADAAATGAALAAQVDWLVVDHYALDHRWESRLRPKAGRLMVIDDLADRPHACDLLLDHNVTNLGAERYRDRLLPECQRLLGPSFALISPAFAANRPKRSGSAPVMRALLFVTAGDPLNLTSEIIRKLASPEWSSLQLDVVTGSVNRNLAELRSICAARSGTALHVDTTSMPQLCALADMAIGAAGGAALERCAMALPTLLLVLAANQRPGSEVLQALGAVELLHQAGPDDLGTFEAQFRLLVSDKEKLKRIGSRGSTLVDGRGAERVTDVMLRDRPAVYLRHALRTDAEWLLDLRNHPATRAASLTTDIVLPDDHLAWLDRTLSHPARMLIVGMSGKQRIGTTRFDFDANSTASVSIAIAPEFQGQGLSSDLLRQSELWALAHRPAITRFVAVVRKTNARSQQLFVKAGYLPIAYSFETVTFSKDA
jgi:UDP-2,4-diacetamido-2,4,6-trideoxy-beta-L-altropyranose hydrolase